VADEVIAGRYRLEERLGAGGMSEVWSAQDLDLDRKVAVKLLAPHADRARFEREARAAAALAHPNICTLYDYGETGGRPFMVLEYLPGGSLEDCLAPGRPLPDDETHRIATEIAAGLAHAHERGLVHRDLKPSNVLFDAQGRPKIADFGIARLGESDGLTAVGTVLGTAAYMSPEQAAGGPVPPASDVYSFGVILYRMLAGRLPFESEDALAMVALHCDESPPPLSRFRPDAPARLESVATAALAKSPVDRPRDGAALLTELGTSPPAVDETAATQVLRPASQLRIRTAAVAAALLVVAGVALAIALTFGDDTHPAPPSTSMPTTQSTTTPATAPIAPAALPPTTSTAAAVSPSATTLPEPTTLPTTAPTSTTLPVATLPPSPPPSPPTPLPPPPFPATTEPPPATTDTTTAETTAPTDTATTAVTTPGPQG
jgi:eukaryotic-like serine/threonine-protein kinase